MLGLLRTDLDDAGAAAKRASREDRSHLLHVHNNYVKESLRHRIARITRQRALDARFDDTTCELHETIATLRYAHAWFGGAARADGRRPRALERACASYGDEYYSGFTY